MDRLNDNQSFEPQDLLELAEKFESPDVETRQRATHDLAIIAFRAIQTESGSEQLSNLLNPDNTDSLPEQKGTWAYEYEQALDQLAEIKQEFDILLETTKSCLWQWNATTGKKTFNNDYFAMPGYTLQKLEKFKVEHIEMLFTHPDDLIKSDELFTAYINGEIDNYESELRIKSLDGSWTWVKDTAKITSRDSNGDVTQIIGTRTDINELHKAKLQNKQWIQSFITSALGIALGTNGKLQIGMNNYAFEKMYGYPVNELAKLSFTDLFAPELRSEIENSINENYTSFHRHAESIHIKKDGLLFPVIVDMNIERDNRGEVMFSSINVIDITEIKQLETELKEKILYDSLTGVFSRHHLNEQSEIIKGSRLYPVSIINIDIDGLKVVNDSYGHVAGDELLKKMGIVLRDVFRKEDCVCRSGGDEFVILLPEMDEKSVVEKIDEITTRLAHFNQIGSVHPLSISIGTATADNFTNWDIAIKTADDNMYANKAAKKNGVIPQNNLFNFR